VRKDVVLCFEKFSVQSAECVLYPILLSSLPIQFH